MKLMWMFLASLPVLTQVAMADDYTCPASIEIKEQLVSDPADWNAMFAKSSGDIVYLEGREATDTLSLIDITLYSGEPKDDVVLSPDNAEQLGEAEEGDSIWTLGSAEEQQQNPAYVACNYGSSISIFKKIAAPVKSCSWHFTPEGGNNVLSCTPL